MINENSLISIVVPVYNAEKYIDETVQSVIRQSYKNWELIIVDDCSRDRSRDIINQYAQRDKRIRLIESETNFGGPARPRNIGIENTKGDYVAFLDADDVWKENKLALQLGFMQENNLDFSSTGMHRIDSLSNKIKSFRYSLTDFIDRFRKKATLCDLMQNNFIITSSVMIKRNILFNFSEKKEFISIEDFDLWIRIFNEGVKYRYLDNKSVFYRLLEVSISDRASLYRQDLKANLSSIYFLLENEQFYRCWEKRVAVQFFKRRIKSILKYLIFWR